MYVSLLEAIEFIMFFILGLWMWINERVLSLRTLRFVWCVHNFHVLWIEKHKFYFHITFHSGSAKKAFWYTYCSWIKKKMTQAFMDDYNFSFSLLFRLCAQRSFFWFNDSINIIFEAFAYIFSLFAHKKK